VFEDNFDYLDYTKWQHEITAGGGGNWEFQYYTNNRSNSYTKDGNLYIKPTLTVDKFTDDFLTTGMLDIWGNHPPNECTGNAWWGCQRVGNPDNIINPVQSARLRTSHSFYFRYGRVEARARMPKGDWIWPAIWLLPRFEEYGMWPTSGEIDLVESRGNLDLRKEDGTQVGNTFGGQTLHWGPFFEGNRYPLTNADFHADLADNFHEYAVEWNKDSIVFELDGNEIMKVEPPEGGFWEMGEFDKDFPGIDNAWQHGDKMAPFDREFYIIMNVAIGGTGGFFPDSWTNAAYPKPWSDQSETAPRDFWNARANWYPTWNPEENNGEDAAMEVDYVRVYKMSEDDLSQ
jgi:beta-glucanase (GH16 family)